jgi:heptosyltransferase II
MKILVRLPNWLGDMVMSVAFIHQLKQIYPQAEISVITKKGIHTLLKFFPPVTNQYIFSKEEYPGLKGAYKFGKLISKLHVYDIFYCLPDSLSSALMGFATGAKKRVGYRKDLRYFLLTHTYKKNKYLHRVEQYVNLLNQYYHKDSDNLSVTLKINRTPQNRIIVNINSEASSRRLPKEKAVSIINEIRKHITEEIVLMGSPAEKDFINEVFSSLKNNSGVHNNAGKTSLPELAELMSSAKLMISTDSGPAHLSNAMGVPTIVLFGAGNEINTAPYNKTNRTIIRLGQLSCEPCQKNICVRFGIPKCLTLLNEENIIREVLKYI